MPTSPFDKRLEELQERILDRTATEAECLEYDELKTAWKLLAQPVTIAEFKSDSSANGDE